MKTVYRRCQYCATTLSRWTASKRRGTEDEQGTCNTCKAALRTVEQYWPDREPTRKRVKAVREHFDKLDRLWNGWPPSKKLKYEILRERKKLLQGRFVGKRVSYKHGHHEGEGIVRDVKIHHGRIFYHFEGRSSGVKRSRLDRWEIVDDAPGS